MIVSIIGTGNVAYHLIRAFQEAGVQIGQVVGRNKKSLKSLKDFKGFKQVIGISKAKFQKEDLVILAVSDSAIKEVSIQLSLTTEVTLVHTSGSVSASALSKATENFGVFYPLQTFSQSVQVKFSEIPICLEASNGKSLSTLKELSNLLGCKIHHINSYQRKYLHISAVIANNFTNYLVGEAKDILDHKKIDYKILEPLVFETVKKAFQLDPKTAQTGPARRGDLQTINNHLEMIENEDLKKLYELISLEIHRRYKK